MPQVLKERDTDQDGFLNFQEFIGHKGRSEDKEWLVTEKDRSVAVLLNVKSVKS